MAKKTAKTTEATTVTELESIAVKLDALQAEAETLGEEKVASMIERAAKSARWYDQQRQAKKRRVGDVVAKMKAKGMTPEQIVAELTK